MSAESFTQLAKHTQLTHNVTSTSLQRCNDVLATLCVCWVTTPRLGGDNTRTDVISTCEAPDMPEHAHGLHRAVFL